MKKTEPELNMQLSPDKIRFFLQNNPFMKMSDIAFQILSDEILSFRITPGSRLNISTIAQSLKISRTPVINAINRLCDCGLVSEEQHGKNKLYYVITTSDKALTDQFAARRAVETVAAGLCAGQVNALDLSRMRKLAVEYKKLWENYSLDPNAAVMKKIVEMDERFHHSILESSMNPYLAKMYDCNQERFSYLALLTNDIIARRKNTATICLLASQHLMICDAIESGVPQLASQAMERHLDFCHQHVLIDR